MRYIVADTECDIGTGLYQLVELSGQVDAFIGKCSRYWLLKKNITHMSYRVFDTCMKDTVELQWLKHQ